MKNILSILFIITISNTIHAQGINFEHGTFKEALAKAKAENKMVFMDCFTTWCGPCKVMSKDVFPHQEVGDYMNANFVSFKMDMEKGEGIELTKRYNVNAYPTLLFMDANGKVLHTKVGSADAVEFIAEAKIAFDPTKQFPHLEKQYIEGNRDLRLVSAYIKGLYEAFKSDEVKKVGKDIIPTMSKEQLATVDGFTILAYTGIDYNSETYNYILKNQSVFADIEGIGQESVDYVISNAISAYVGNIAKTGTLDDLKNAIEKTKKDFVSPYQEMIESNFYNEHYLANSQFNKWLENNKKLADNLVKSDKGMSQSVYINTAYRVATDPIFEGNSEMYNNAIKMTENVKAEDQEFLASYYCLASLYKKTGNKEKALENINDFIVKNAVSGGDNDKRAIDLKAEIENM